MISIADSFSSAELRKRIEIGNAVAIVTVERITRAGKTIAILDKVREAEAPPAIVIGLDASTPRATSEISCTPYLSRIQRARVVLPVECAPTR